jgi:DNA invertase Pin-like site-specific DNA recombinase
MRVGYKRTSTGDQVAGYEAQERDLREAKCDRIFGEQLSSVDADRPQLEAVLDFIREGDVLVVTKLDRLARSVVDALTLEKRIKAKGATLRILDPGIDTSTDIGRFIFTVLASVAELERGMMLARQREGVAKARADGKYLGRKPTAKLKADEIRKLNAEGLGASAIAAKLGLHRASVHRILADTADAEGARLEGRLKTWRERNKDAAA